MTRLCLFLTALLAILGPVLLAQNTFPVTGNIGINLGGATSSNKLQIGSNPQGWNGNDLVISGDGSRAALALASDASHFYLFGDRDIAIRPGFGKWSVYAKASNGFVGIGTTQPKHTLHVKGRIYLEGTEAVGNWAQNYFHWRGHSLIMGTEVDRYAHNRIEVKPGGSTSGPLYSYFQMYSTPSPENHELKIQLSSYGDSFINGGNLGIGTNDPNNRLEIFGTTFNRVAAVVNADVQNGYQIRKDGTNATSWEMYTPAGSTDLRFHNSTWGDLIQLNTQGLAKVNGFVAIGPVTSYGSRLTIADGVGGEQLKFTRGTGILRFAQEMNKDNLFLTNRDASKTFMTWLENGNVGIGTRAPDQALTVKGKIHSEEVIVDLSVPGPDYVFEPDYNLPSLDSIETYIKANKHLPEVPSAKEMEANGISLSEMNMILLKKVEELTLHLIRQEATIKTQQEQINSLLDLANSNHKK